MHATLAITLLNATLIQQLVNHIWQFT